MTSSGKNMKRRAMRMTYRDNWLLECSDLERPREETELNIRWCLQHDASADAASSCGSSALHAAARRAHAGLARLLLRHRAAASAADHAGETPLHLAVRYGDGTEHVLERGDGAPARELDIVDMLLDAGADVNVADCSGDTPLHVAVRSGAASAVLRLLAHGADVNFKNFYSEAVLHLATYRGEAPIVCALLEHGASVHALDGADNTPLHLAARRGECFIVERLLAGGARLEATNRDRDSPLHLAVRAGRRPVAALLLAKGARVNGKNNAGVTALHDAADDGDKDAVKLLLKCKADVNAQDNAGAAALHRAVVKAHGPTLRLLLARGADVGAATGTGDTALYLAVTRGEPATVETLLQHGAAPDTAGGAGDAPLHAAAYCGRLLIAELLLRYGAAVDRLDPAGNTPLHLAARRRHARLVRLLLNHGADPRVRNSDYSTPLTVARVFHFEGCDEIVSLLENAAVSLGSRSQGRPSECVQSINELTILDSKLQIASHHNEMQTETLQMFTKKSDTSGMCGQLYETKLLSLVLIRALNDEQIEDFFLGTNNNNVGDMDDICLWYRVKGQQRPILLFVQAKHREDREKSKLTVEDVQGASGDYSLRKYFDSYLKIKERFQVDSEDVIFQRDFHDVECNFVIYTPAMECFSRKNTRRPVSEKVHYLINTEENTEAFQYDYDEDDVEDLTKRIVINQFKIAGEVFLAMVMSEKDKSDMILMEQIAKYHVIFGREVLQPCKNQPNKEHRMWEFRPQFFESNSEYLIALKRIFCEELSTKRIDQSKITDADRENFDLVLKNPCETTISKLIGKLATYYEKTKKLKLIEVADFKKKIKKEFTVLLEQFNNIEANENIINKAVEIKLLALKIKLPLSFGNLDMTFRGNANKVQKRIKAVADKLVELLKSNEDTMIIDINNKVVGKGKTIEQGFIDINGGIGSAVGNLLVVDPETKMLKFRLDIESLPENAALFLKELKDARHKPFNENLSSYRFMINVNGFPTACLNGDVHYVEIERQAKYFLNKLFFYTNQAQQDEVEHIVKNDIDKYYNNEKDAHQIKFKIHSDAIFRSVHGEIQKWWQKASDAIYLTQKNDFYQKAKLECFNNILLTILNYVYESKTCGIDFKLNPHIQQSNACIEAPVAFDLAFGQTFKLLEKQGKQVNVGGTQKIKDLVQCAEKLAKYYVAACTDPSMIENILYHPESQGDIVINIMQNNVKHEFEVGEFKYPKRAGTSGVSGQLYKTKLLCLVLIRALNDEQIEDFILGTSIRDIGVMDDICLKYRVKGYDRPIALFLQTKHKDKVNISVDEVKNYCESYLTVKNQFLSEYRDTMFEGQFCDIDWNFVLHTPASDKNIENKIENRVSEKLHYLINTNNESKGFQFEYDKKDEDLLTNIITIERLKKLGAVFMDLVLFETDNLEVILFNNLIAQYHVVIGREVLQPCKVQQSNKEYRIWEFRSTFLEKKCEYLSTLKKTFISELSTKCWNRSKFADEDRDNFQLVLRDQCPFTISKVVGKLAVYNNKTKKLQLVADFKNELMLDEKFKLLAEKFDEIECSDNDINDATLILMKEMTFKLPYSFGNLDVTFCGRETDTKRKVEEVADNIIKILELNKDSKVVDISDILSTGKIKEHDYKYFYGTIKNAFGNLLVLSPDTKMLIFDSDNKNLPENASLLLKELKDDRHKPINEELNSYQIKVSIDEFPKHSLGSDEDDVRHAKYFLNKFWFYANQAKEDVVELILKDEINRCYSKVGTNFSSYYGSLPEIIYQSSYEDIQNWWMQTSQAPYLTKKCTLFERIKETEIAHVLQTIINFMFISKTTSVDIKFKEGIKRYFKFVKMHQMFNNMSTTLFRLFDEDFNDLINIELPDIDEPSPYSNYTSLGELVFTLEIQQGMEWVALKMWAVSTYNQYFLLAKAGPGTKFRRARDGFMLQQICNGRSGQLIKGERDPDVIYSYVS